MSKCAKSLTHSWKEIREGIQYCPKCNTVLCDRHGNLIQHLGLIVTSTNPAPTGLRGQVVQFRTHQQA